MERISTVVVDKITDCVREFNLLTSLDCLVSGGQSLNFWKTVKRFEKTQKQVKTTARKFIVELPKSFTKKSATDLELLAQDILSFVTVDYTAPYFTWFIRTAQNNADNIHMIILLSERTRSTDYVLHRNDVYYNYDKKKISNATDPDAIQIAKKGEVKLDKDGYPIENKQLFGIKLETLKTKRYLYSLREKIAALFNSFGEKYTPRLKKGMISCIRYKNSTTAKQKKAAFTFYLVIQKVKSTLNHIELNNISLKLKKISDFSEKILFLNSLVNIN